MAEVVYPVILTPAKEGGYCVYVPDFDRDTQGDDLAEAIHMAEDLISLMGVCLEDDGIAIPHPSNVDEVKIEYGEIKTLVAVDFTKYRKKIDSRVVRKAVTIPSWLECEANAAGINFSATLQDALKEKLAL